MCHAGFGSMSIVPWLLLSFFYSEAVMAMAFPLFALAAFVSDPLAQYQEGKLLAAHLLLCTCLPDCMSIISTPAHQDTVTVFTFWYVGERVCLCDPNHMHILSIALQVWLSLVICRHDVHYPPSCCLVAAVASAGAAQGFKLNLGSVPIFYIAQRVTTYLIQQSEAVTAGCCAIITWMQ